MMLPDPRKTPKTVNQESFWYQPEHAPSSPQDDQVRLGPELKRLFSLTFIALPPAFPHRWRLVVVQDRALQEKIRILAGNGLELPEGALLVIICAEVGVGDNYPGKIPPIQPGNLVQPGRAAGGVPRLTGPESRDAAIFACGVAAQTLMLTAKALGYDSQPLPQLDSEMVGRLIHVPPGLVVAHALVIGKNLGETGIRANYPDFGDVVVTDRF